MNVVRSLGQTEHCIPFSRSLTLSSVRLRAFSSSSSTAGGGGHPHIVGHSRCLLNLSANEREREKSSDHNECVCAVLEHLEIICLDRVSRKKEDARQ